MRIVWLSWRDKQHIHAGGAELVQHEICKRLAADGHQVTIITSRSGDTAAEEIVDGYRVIRRGGLYSVYWHAWRTYCQRFRGQTDLVVEEVNTAPFFSRFYANTQRIMLFHQLCRQIWFYQYIMPLNFFGWLSEPIYLRLAKAKHVVAMSPSTMRDLCRQGYRRSHIRVISEGITLPPVSSLAKVNKPQQPSILAYGAVRPMKRTHHILQAFEKSKQHVKDLKLTIAGPLDGKYGQKVLDAIQNSPYKQDIQVLGRIDDSQKTKVLSSHHFSVATATKEGWGLTITEAASQGTPAIAYDVDGQRDAVYGGQAGVLVPPGVRNLAKAIAHSFAATFDYKKLQHAAWEKSKQINFDQTYRDFTQALEASQLQPATEQAQTDGGIL